MSMSCEFGFQVSVYYAWRIPAHLSPGICVLCLADTCTSESRYLCIVLGGYLHI